MEKRIEKAFNMWAKSKGWMHRKYVTPGKKGAFDRIYHKMGVTAYIEWKQPGGEMSVHQIETQEELHAHQIPAECFDNTQDAKVWLDSLDPQVIPLDALTV